MATEYTTTHEAIQELIAQLNDAEVTFMSGLFEEYAANYIQANGPESDPWENKPGVAIMAEQLGDEIEARDGGGDLEEIK